MLTWGEMSGGSLNEQSVCYQAWLLELELQEPTGLEENSCSWFPDLHRHTCVPKPARMQHRHIAEKENKRLTG